MHLDVKCLPFNSRGTVAIADVSAVSINTIARAGLPYPPGNVKVNGNFWPDGAHWPGQNAALTWAHRNRTTLRESGGIVQQDAGNQGAVEGSYRIEVLLDGQVQSNRTLIGVVGTSFTYLYTDFQADDPTETKAVQFRITPINGSLIGRSRTTDAFYLGAA